MIRSFHASSNRPRKTHARIDEKTEYGYLWWHRAFVAPDGRSHGAWYMSGNGGNKVVIIPGLDLAVVIASENYNTRGMHDLTDRLLEEFVLGSLFAPNATAELEREIAAQNRAMEAAFRRGDLTAVAAFYTDTAVLLAPGRPPVSGRKAIDAYWAGFKDPVDWRLEVLSVEGNDRLVTQRGRGAARPRVQKAQHEGDGRLRRQRRRAPQVEEGHRGIRGYRRRLPDHRRHVADREAA